MTGYSEYVRIETPENVLLDAEVAGFGSRCVAALVDYLILTIVSLLFAYFYLNAVRDSQTNPILQAGLLAFVLFLLIVFYHLTFEFMWNGQTPGKRVFGLRVVMANGLPLTTSAAVIRNLVRLFDFLPFAYAVGLISLFATRSTQRLGDLAAQTIVIRERPQLTLRSVQENWGVNYEFVSRLAPLPSYIDITYLDENDRRDVVSFLQRRAELQAKDYIVGLLSERIAARMKLSDPAVDLRSSQRAEVFLEQVARAFEIAEHNA